ncbi:hypothetical protein BABINDRAFT_149308 [Babjeviella inositovora NRRL Y-12698]|uniref:Uncharacterized protein n=1 Tax=Babjeviella inositovora NRRL Y-12698 TaxID=984486 RepID=A0A1E3QQE6_9ASCO|nr:uncharacterized protein BABINDRAFT_149308 [Babjeviella inositovora NRRL Y-12698]ODQ79177.1 hypothetical protein BABINDRAFT_149308 [Babjeviella inositovora NRRL Y-12698]
MRLILAVSENIIHSRLFTTTMGDSFQLGHLYRRLVRLRPYLVGNSHAYRHNYHQYIRHKITHLQEYNTRRRKILGLLALSDNELCERATRTLHFLHNAACDVAPGQPQPWESRIFVTLMEMEYSKYHIKKTILRLPVDRSYNWFDRCEEYVQLLKEASTEPVTKKRLQETKKQADACHPLIALREYEIGLIRFNESAGLML